LLYTETSYLKGVAIMAEEEMEEAVVGVERGPNVPLDQESPIVTIAKIAILKQNARKSI
jgi:hypothetical protein